MQSLIEKIQLNTTSARITREIIVKVLVRMLMGG